jgi:hypothetical protein
MFQPNETQDFRIEWDLHEFGPRAAYQLQGPSDPKRLAFARALAAGDIPANANGPRVDDDQDQAA